jgi:hypothetical protein
MKSKIIMNLNKDSISVSIDSLNSNIDNVRSFVKRNFTDFKISIESIYLPPNLLANKIEKANRLKLIKWCLKEANIKDSKLIKGVLNSFEQKIQIDIKAYHVNQDIISIRVFEHNDLVVFKLHNQYLPIISNIILNFLKRQFSVDEIYRLDKENQELFIKKDTVSFQSNFERTINRGTIIGKKSLFFYDRDLVERLLQGYKKTPKEGISAREYIRKLKDAFNTLEIDSSIKDLQLIKRRYLFLAKKYHPDKNQNRNETLKKEFEKRFLLIKEAFEIIKLHLEKSA